MNITPVGSLSVSRSQSRPRLSRFAAVVLAIALSTAGAWAQSLAVSTIGGTAGSSGSSNTGLGTFNIPYGAAVDSSGNVYIADAGNHVIRKISSTGVVSKLVGTVGTSGNTDDATAGAPAALFNTPRGIAINAAGTTLYVADTSNHRIRVVVLSGVGGTVTGVSTLAGSTAGFSNTGAGQFTLPVGIVADGSGNLFVADTGNQLIRKIVIAGPTVSTLAGVLSTTTFADGAQGTATFNTPYGVALNGAGSTLYVADYNNHRIRAVTVATGATATYAGTGTATFVDNATGTSATFHNPSGVAVDASGNIFVADFGNNAIRKIAASGTNAVTTVAGPSPTGNANPGATGSADGTGTSASFNGPFGVAFQTVSSIGFVFIADTTNQLIRKAAVASAATVGNPADATAAVGANGVTFTATVTGGWPAPTLQWERQANGSGAFTAITASSTYLNVTTSTLTINGVTLAMQGDKFRLSATNSSGTVASATPATLTVTQAPVFGSPSVTFNATVGQPISGAAVVATGSGTITYTLTTPGSFGTAFSLASSGTITGTPSSTLDSVSNVSVTATNNVGSSTQNVTINVTSTSAPSISAQPASAVTVIAGNTATFNVTASGTPTPTYQWQVSTDGGSTFNDLSNGAITGGTVSGATTNSLSIASVTTALTGYKYRVRVTNSVSSVNSGVSTLTVNSVPVITNSTVSFSIQAGQTFGGVNITTSGTPAPTSYAVSSGALPSWASLNTSTGAITATRATTTGDAGVSTFNITATNSVGTSAAVQFTLTVTNGPTINSGPANVSIFPGAQAQFSVNATASAGTLSYQWYRALAGTGVFSQALPDNTSYFVSSSGGTSTLTVSASSTTSSMNGDQFRVVVTDSNGSTTSTTATLTILQVPAFTSAASATFSETVNGPAFNVQATGSPAPNISITSGSLPGGLSANLSTGTNSSTLVISGTPANGTNTSSPYTLQFTANNSAGSVNQSFTLTVLPVPTGPVFSTQPTSQSVSIGQTATFTVVVTGSPTPTLQWQRQPTGTTGFVNVTDGGAYSGATTATLTVTGAATGMSGDQFQCVATNSGGTTTSTAAALTVTTGTAVTTIAGQAGVTGSFDATGLAATFNSPSSVAVDSAGNIFVADTVNSVIRKITSAGVVTTYAGLAGTSGSADGTATAARFNGPYGVAVDASGNVYVADTFNHTIRLITPAGNVTTVAGLGGSFGSTDDTGSAARFAYPTGVAVTGSGVVYVADSFNHTIRVIAVGGAVTTYAGVAGSRGSADGSANVGLTAGTARFANPSAVAVDGAGNVYVADTGNHTIRKITPTATVSTLAGLAGTSGSTDGTGTAARFNQPNGLALDPSANVYVADTFNHTIRKVTPAGVVTTLAGLAGTVGTADGTGSAARFNRPYGIAVDNSGNIFVADTSNQTIRRSGTFFAPTITTQPLDKGVAAGQTATFTVAATGSPAPNYQWQRQPAGTTGFVNLANDSTYGGVTTAILTITNVTTAMSGDQFKCVVRNFVSPDAVTNTVTLTSNLIAPVFTSATSATFTAGQLGAFTVAASGTPAPTYSATGLPPWATLDSATGVLSGTPPDASGSPFNLTLTANNGVSATQTFTLTVLLPVTAPTITTQPVGATLNRGDSASFTVVAAGTVPLSYQWSKNGSPIAAATGATLTLNNVQAVNAGSYSVQITNTVGVVTSSAATLVINTPPTITTQPRGQAALAGSSTSLTVTATGSPAPTYQWRFNGTAIAGANSATLTLPSVQSVNTGNYDVVVTNSLGSVTSSLAQLTVTSTTAAPVILSSPASATALLTGSATFSVVATGVPAPTYQWRKDGVAIGNATLPVLTLNGVLPSNAGSYDVVVTNSAGSATSLPASLSLITRSYAGIYFGTLSGGAGNFALLVRSNNTAIFVGVVPGLSPSGIVNPALTINDAGGFSFISGAATVLGSIANDGTVGGSVAGTVSASLSGTRSPDIGAVQSLAGFYRAGVTNGSGAAYAIVNATGQAIVVTQTAALSDGGVGVSDNTGRIAIATTRQSIAAVLSPETGTVTITASAGSQVTTFTGGSESVIAAQRLSNISTRARVDTGANIAIAGFVISGNEAKPVLIRAIGPTLSSFGVPSALAAPKLELFRGSTVIASNTGWNNAGNSAAIVAASAQAGAFALAANSADSVIFTTLPPGPYTAQVSAASGAPGVALIEVYDLSAAAAGQKLFNISTRANAGTGDATLIAGISVNGTAPKRVLIRAVGPGLAQFGLTGVLAQPVLQLVKDGVVVASNTGVNTSADAAAIVTASAQVGAFALPAGSADSALLVNLAPGNYSAVVSGANGGSGIAIVEVYEVP